MKYRYEPNTEIFRDGLYLQVDTKELLDDVRLYARYLKHKGYSEGEMYGEIFNYISFMATSYFSFTGEESLKKYGYFPED